MKTSSHMVFITFGRFCCRSSLFSSRHPSSALEPEPLQAITSTLAGWLWEGGGACRASYFGAPCVSRLCVQACQHKIIAASAALDGNLACLHDWSVNGSRVPVIFFSLISLSNTSIFCLAQGSRPVSYRPESPATGNCPTPPKCVCFVLS